MGRPRDHRGILGPGFSARSAHCTSSSLHLALFALFSHLPHHRTRILLGFSRCRHTLCITYVS